MCGPERGPLAEMAAGTLTKTPIGLRRPKKFNFSGLFVIFGALGPTVRFLGPQNLRFRSVVQEVTFESPASVIFTHSVHFLTLGAQNR